MLHSLEEKKLLFIRAFLVVDKLKIGSDVLLSLRSLSPLSEVRAMLLV